MKQHRVDSERPLNRGTDPRAVRPRLESGDRVAEAYVVKTLLGRGATADVYEAIHEPTGTEVAIKLAHSHRRDADAALRFKRESRIFASVRSAYVAKLFDTDRMPDGSPYIVLERAPGEPLDELLARGPMPLPVAVSIASQLLHALDAIHAAGVVHRDISPANVIVHEDPSGPQVKLVDFGIAKTNEDLDTTEPGVIIGTPPYLAPEQIRGDQVDERTDLYGVGAVLYEMLTGQSPYQGETVGEMNMAILEGRLRPARAINRDIPARIDTIVVRAMHPDPNLRFESASEMRDALEPSAEAQATDAAAAIPLVRKAVVRPKTALVEADTREARTSSRPGRPALVPQGSLSAVLESRGIPGAPRTPSVKGRSSDQHKAANRKSSDGMVIPLARKKREAAPPPPPPEARGVQPLPSEPVPADPELDDAPMGDTLLDRGLEAAISEAYRTGTPVDWERYAAEAEARSRAEAETLYDDSIDASEHPSHDKVDVWEMHSEGTDPEPSNSGSRLAVAVEDIRLSRAARRAIQRVSDVDEPIVLPTSKRNRTLIAAFTAALVGLAAAWWVAFVGPTEAQRIAFGAYGTAQATVFSWVGQRAPGPEAAPVVETEAAVGASAPAVPIEPALAPEPSIPSQVAEPPSSSTDVEPATAPSEPAPAATEPAEAPIPPASAIEPSAAAVAPEPETTVPTSTSSLAVVPTSMVAEGSNDTAPLATEAAPEPERPAAREARRPSRRDAARREAARLRRLARRAQRQATESAPPPPRRTARHPEGWLPTNPY